MINQTILAIFIDWTDGSGLCINSKIKCTGRSEPADQDSRIWTVGSNPLHKMLHKIGPSDRLASPSAGPSVGSDRGPDPRIRSVRVNGPIRAIHTNG